MANRPTLKEAMSLALITTPLLLRLIAGEQHLGATKCHFVREPGAR